MHLYISNLARSMFSSTSLANTHQIQSCTAKPTEKKHFQKPVNKISAPRMILCYVITYCICSFIRTNDIEHLHQS